MCGSATKNIGMGLLTGGIMGAVGGSMSYDEQQRVENERKREAKKQADAQNALMIEMNKPSATVIDPVVDSDTKAKKLRALRYGMTSTVKTSPLGVSNSIGKTKLGQ